MNLKKNLISYISLIVIFILIAIGAILLLILNNQYWAIALGILGMTFGVFGVGVFTVLLSKKYLNKNLIIKDSFNSFVNDIVAYNSLGVVVFDNNYKIIWVSEYIQKNFGKNIVGISLHEFFSRFQINFDINKTNINFDYNNASYVVDIWPLKNCLSIKDNSNQQKLLKAYQNEASVIGEIELDNYSLYQSVLSEEDLYNVNKIFISVLDKLMEKYNFVYRQYTDGKFLVFTDKESLDKMCEYNFNFFNKLHDVLKNSKQNNLILSCSAGFAIGYKSLNEKIEEAKNALLLAKSRGGDQVVIVSNISRPKYYGTAREILYDISKTKITSITNVIESKMNDPQIKKVIIYGHANADLDALGSALGIYAIAKAFKKEAYICSMTQDATTKKAIKRFLPEQKEIFIKAQQANKLTDENTLIFLVDNSDIKRTDNKDCITNAKTNNIFILDHHRLGVDVDFCPKINRYIDSAASSASEIVTEIIMFMQRKIKLSTNIAQMLLNGIYLDTLQFTKHVNARTFLAAGWLEEKGADSAKSSEILKIDEFTQLKVNELLENIQEIKPGYYLAYKDMPLSDDVISIAAEEILRISNRKAAFVVARLEKEKIYKMSARSFIVNVQLIAEEVGGGGHFGTAAATSKEDFNVFIDNIKQAIVSVGNESNFN